MGAPAVPGSGIIMLLIVLGAIGVEPEGLALILAIDRPLDMLRTIPNIVGDAIVAAIVDKSEGKRIAV
jgi:Na+/H+-dicarboxylate symporter